MQPKQKGSLVVLILMSLAALIMCPQAPQQNYTAAGILFWATQIDSVAATTQVSRDLMRPDSTNADSTPGPPDTLAGFVNETRFVAAARCNAAMPGTVRGMLIGRFDEPGQAPVDTPLVGALIQLIVTPVGSAGGKYFDRLAATTQGQFFFSGVPTTGHYELEAMDKVIRDFRYTVSTGFVQDIGKRCLLPSKDGRVPLSRYQRDVLKDKGVL